MKQAICVAAYCTSSPCINNGTCVETTCGMTCTCQLGYTGVYCQTGTVTMAMQYSYSLMSVITSIIKSTVLHSFLINHTCLLHIVFLFRNKRVRQWTVFEWCHMQQSDWFIQMLVCARVYGDLLSNRLLIYYLITQLINQLIKQLIT